MSKILDEKWELGALNRGHGHCSFAVITADGKMIIRCDTDKELAERIIKDHNAGIKP